MRQAISIVLASVALALSLVGCEGGGDSMSETGVCSPRAASFGSLGELTAFPGIGGSVSSPSLDLIGVNFVAQPAVDDFLPVVRVFAEVENIGFERLCAGSYTVSLGGFTGPAALTGTLHTLPPSGISVACLTPGERGVIAANLFRATEEDLLTATTLRISVDRDPISGMGEQPYGATMLSDQRIEIVDGGYRLVQTVAADRDVLNYYQDVYAIDARGLIIAGLHVPADGATAGGAALSAGVPEELVSNVLDCEFVDFFVAGDHYFE